MKKLLAILVLVLIPTRVLAEGMVIDYVNNDISAKSGSMTIDGQPVAGGIDVKSGTVAVATAGTTVTFNTAFSTTPDVVLTTCTNQDSDIKRLRAYSITTTSFIARNNATLTACWIATNAGNP